MYPKAVTAFLMALATIQLSTRTLLAKPTRMLARPAARRLIIAEPTPRSAHEHVARVPIVAHSHGGSAERITSISVRSRASRPNNPATRIIPTRGRPVSAPASARKLRSDIHADRLDTRAARMRRANVPIERASRDSSPKPRNPHRSRPLPDGTASGDEVAGTSHFTSLASSRTLADFGGALRTAPGSLPLKSIEEEASTPVLLPALRVSSLYDNHGHLIVPPPLYGSRENLLHQNQMADRDGLDRVQNDADLLDLRREKKLVALPDNETLRVDFHLPENRRFSRPWTAAFLTVLARDYYDSFHSPLQVDSAVRTVEVQQRLIRINGNAAPSTGDTASPHLTGQAVDIAKGGLSRTQIAWLRTYLQPLIDLGKIDVEEEFQQSCFHISVYRNFVPISTPPHSNVAAAYQLPADTLPEGPIE